MKPSDYPYQEPLPEFAKPYASEVLKLGEGIPCDEILYGQNPYQSLSIFRPSSSNGRTLIFMHGGGWTCGYKEWNSFMAPIFTDAGFVFVTVGYRLAPQYIFPAGFNDCADAVAWIHDNISQYSGTPDALYVGGHSAGGHYAALLALATWWKEDRNLPDDVIKGCLPISGTYYFGDDSGLSTRPRFLGPAELGYDKIASPLQYLDSPPSAFLIGIGAEDFSHLIAQSQNFALALRDHGHSVDQITIADSGHLDSHLSTGVADNAWSLAAMDWMLQQT